MTGNYSKITSHYYCKRLATLRPCSAPCYFPIAQGTSPTGRDLLDTIYLCLEELSSDRGMIQIPIVSVTQLNVECGSVFLL